MQLKLNFYKMNNYKISGRIGQGAHGYVMKGIHKYTGEEVAMKKLLIKSLANGIPKAIMREVTALSVLSHENIVELLDVFPCGMGIILVMELLPINMQDIIKDEKLKLNLPQIKYYMKMLFQGLSFIHDNNIMHRDLKPANLLIAANGQLKIGDFGLARIYVSNAPHREYSHQVATRWYRAPELLYGSRNYNSSIDIWAAGCILAEIITKTPLFQGETDIEQLAIVLYTLGSPDEINWPRFSTLPDYHKIIFARSPGIGWNNIIPNANADSIDLLKRCILYDMNKRVSAKEALNLDLFTKKPVPAVLSNMPKPEHLHTADLSLPGLENFDEIIENLIEGFQ